MRAHEHIKFWHDATLSNLELLHATYVTHTFAPHTHEGYMIGVIEQGVKQFTYRRSQHTAPVGSIVLSILEKCIPARRQLNMGGPTGRSTHRLNFTACCH